MIDLVLEHQRSSSSVSRSTTLHRRRCAHQHLLGADDLDVEAGDRQATLLVHPLAVAFDDDGVEDRLRVVVEVPHDDLLLHADLWAASANLLLQL